MSSARSTLRRYTSMALLVAGSAAALFAASSPALAWAPRVNVSVNFVVPAHIDSYSVPTYQPYYIGRVYFRPHHHDHLIYGFPVQTPGGVVFEPYTYCEGVLIRVGYIPGYDPRYDDYRAGYDRPIFDGAPVDAAWLSAGYTPDPYCNRGYVQNGYDRVIVNRRYVAVPPRYDRYDDRRYDRYYDRRYDRRWDRDRNHGRGWGHDRDHDRDYDRDGD